MQKSHAKDLLYLSDKCPECKKGKMKVVKGIINIGNYFLRCEECGFEYDD